MFENNISAERPESKFLLSVSVQYKGKPGTYTVKAAGYADQLVTLKGNAFYEISFAPDCP